jgi:hypothetical protein
MCFTMVFVSCSLGIRITSALISHNMYQHRSWSRSRFHIPQDRHEVVDVVAIHRANVVETELLE